jgi:hypothetical protein
VIADVRLPIWGDGKHRHFGWLDCKGE